MFDEGAVLVLAEGRAPLGRVEDVFGPVAAPLYALRYAGQGELPPAAVPGAQARTLPCPTTKPGRSELGGYSDPAPCVLRAAGRSAVESLGPPRRLAGRELGTYATMVCRRVWPGWDVAVLLAVATHAAGIAAEWVWRAGQVSALARLSEEVCPQALHYKGCDAALTLLWALCLQSRLLGSGAHCIFVLRTTCQRGCPAACARMVVRMLKRSSPDQYSCLSAHCMCSQIPHDTVSQVRAFLTLRSHSMHSAHMSDTLHMYAHFGDLGLCFTHYSMAAGMMRPWKQPGRRTRSLLSPMTRLRPPTGRGSV